MQKPILRFENFSDDWKEYQLQDVATYRNGKAHEQDIDESGRYKVVNARFVSTNGSTVKNSQKNNEPLFKDEVCLVLSDIPKGRALARTFLVDQDDVYTLNQRVAAIRLNKELVDPLFFANLMNRNPYFLKFDNTVSQTNLSIDNVLKFNFKLPSLKEQKMISEFICQIDKRISLQENKISVLESEKEGYIQKIISKEIRFKDSLNRNFPNWSKSRVDEIYEITRGNVLAASKVKSNKTSDYIYPVFSSQTLNEGLMGYYNEYLFEDAINWTTDGANAGTVRYRKGKFYCTNVSGVLISEKGYANRAMAEIINQVAYRYVSYVGNPKLMNNTMELIKIEYPGLEEQEKISNFLNLLDHRLRLENKLLELLKEIKVGYLQKMFVGL